MGELYLIRHGQASFDHDDYDRLSSLGQQQSQRVAQHLLNRDVRFDAVYSGDLQRQVDTALCYLKQRDGAEVLQPNLLQQSCFNEFPAERIIKHYLPQVLSADPELADLFQQPGVFKQRFAKFFWPIMEQWFAQEEALADIETWPMFRDRVTGGLKRLMQDHEGERIGLFTSGGTISTIVQQALEIPVRRAFEMNVQIVNASITKLRWRHGRLSLCFFNNYDHLEQGDSLSNPESLISFK